MGERPAESRRFKDCNSGQIEKENDSAEYVLQRWVEILNRFKVAVDYDHNSERLHKTIVWHVIIGSTAIYEQAPLVDLDGDQSLITFLEKVLAEFGEKTAE